LGLPKDGLFGKILVAKSTIGLQRLVMAVDEPVSYKSLSPEAKRVLVGRARGPF